MKTQASHGNTAHCLVNNLTIRIQLSDTEETVYIGFAKSSLHDSVLIVTRFRSKQHGGVIKTDSACQIPRQWVFKGRKSSRIISSDALWGASFLKKTEFWTSSPTSVLRVPQKANQTRAACQLFPRRNSTTSRVSYSNYCKVPLTYRTYSWTGEKCFSTGLIWSGVRVDKHITFSLKVSILLRQMKMDSPA